MQDFQREREKEAKPEQNACQWATYLAPPGVPEPSQLCALVGSALLPHRSHDVAFKPKSESPVHPDVSKLSQLTEKAGNFHVQ